MQAALMQAEDADKLAHARTRHHQEEEDRTQRRRLERERRRASKVLDQVPDQEEESFSEQQTPAEERSQPASTSERELDSDTVSIVVSNTRRKARVRAPVKRPVLSGAQASAAARTMGQASWGRTTVARENPWFELRAAKQRGKSKTKINYIVATNPGLRSAQKYLRVWHSSLCHQSRASCNLQLCFVFLFAGPCWAACPASADIVGVEEADALP